MPKPPLILDNVTQPPYASQRIGTMLCLQRRKSGPRISALFICMPSSAALPPPSSFAADIFAEARRHGHCEPQQAPSVSESMLVQDAFPIIWLFDSSEGVPGAATECFKDGRINPVMI